MQVKIVINDLWPSEKLSSLQNNVNGGTSWIGSSYEVIPVCRN